HGNMMSIETAEKCVDLALQSPNNYLSFEFQGGEPLLNFKTIEHIVKYTKMHQGLKKISFNLVSNLTILDEYKINFIKQHHISVSTSLDGDSTLHNINRPCLQGNSYEIWAKNYKILQSQLDCNIGAIQTTTKYSLNKYKEIVDEYIHNGLETVFLRPLTPLGYAATRWDELGYTAEDFVSFYDKSLKYIIERAKNGANIREGHASLFLCKILDHVAGNYTELRSPCGAALGQLAYNYDGAIYTCDEGRMMAEMGDHSFRVGTVHSNYKDLVTGSICKSMAVASCLESIPQCSDCVYSPYCGVCPVLNYASHGNIFADMPNHFKCKIYSGMLDSIFDLLLKNDAATQFILKSWTGNR
ncbi:MAG: His-Xaa-Ser system radical SAM maturase HxsB, partial [Anaerovorax sp.]